MSQRWSRDRWVCCAISVRAHIQICAHTLAISSREKRFSSCVMIVL